MRRSSFDFDGFIMEIVQDRKEDWRDDSYPFSLAAVKNWDHLALHENVTFFVGENGSGKSTLIEAIAIAAGFNPEGGSKNFDFSTEDSHSSLSNHIRLARSTKRNRDGYFLRAESYYNVATQINRLDEIPSFGPPVIESYGGKSLHKQSHGESFMALMEHRLGGDGLYIFDEPEAALSPQRQLSLLSYIDELVKNNSQFIIATHSPIILAYPNAWIYELTPQGPLRANWEDLEHVTITQGFLRSPETYLDILLDNDE